MKNKNWPKDWVPNARVETRYEGECDDVEGKLSYAGPYVHPTYGEVWNVYSLYQYNAPFGFVRLEDVDTSEQLWFLK